MPRNKSAPSGASGLGLQVASFVATLFKKSVSDAISERDEANKLATKVATGKVKMAELNIMAHGGKAISRRQKRIARKAKKLL